VAIGMAIGFSGCTRSQSPPKTAPPSAAARTDATPVFPQHRVVAYYGAAGIPAMGVLGTAPPDAIAARLLHQAHAYDPFGRRVVPAFELIVVVAHGSDPSGKYYGLTQEASARRYLAAVRRIGGRLILDVQPGRSTFLPLVRRYERLLREPDVDLALDPEWEMGPSEIPGQSIGGTTGAEVERVGSYLAALVRRERLPQKLFVVHQFTPDMIAHRDAVRPHPELATTFHVDGFGARPNKASKYRQLATRDPRFHNGLKLFYTQDVAMYAPAEAMRFVPQPDLITYQ